VCAAAQQRLGVNWGPRRLERVPSTGAASRATITQLAGYTSDHDLAATGCHGRHPERGCHARAVVGAERWWDRVDQLSDELRAISKSFIRYTPDVETSDLQFDELLEAIHSRARRGFWGLMRTRNRRRLSP
jgi:hypothetical protein